MHFLNERIHKSNTDSTHRTKKSFSLMPEMQAAMLSVSMLPPIHTWMGFSSLRSDMGEQGRRKPAKPAAHWLDKCMDMDTYREPKDLRINAMKYKVIPT